MFQILSKEVHKHVWVQHGITLSGRYHSRLTPQIQSINDGKMKASQFRAFGTSSTHKASYRRFGEPPRTSSQQPRLVGSIKFPSSNNGNFDRAFRGIPNWIWWLAGGGGVYFVSHLETVEQTGRWRFMDTSVESELAVRLSFARIYISYHNNLTDHPIYYLDWPSSLCANFSTIPKQDLTPFSSYLDLCYQSCQSNYQGF